MCHRSAAKNPAFGVPAIKEYNFSTVLIKGNNIRLTA
jgi:hypothetical protein